MTILRKKILAVILTFAMAFGGAVLYAAPTTVYAKISLTTSQKSNIKKLTKKTIQFSASQISNIAQNKNSASLNFSKASDRKKIMYAAWAGYFYPDTYETKSSQVTISKALFGKSTAYVSDNNMKYYGVYYGDWGDTDFKYKSFKFTKTGDNTYKVTANISEEFHYDEYGNYTEDYTSKTIGTAEFTIKVKSGSKYGFVLSKMSIKAK